VQGVKFFETLELKETNQVKENNHIEDIVTKNTNNTKKKLGFKYYVLCHYRTQLTELHNNKVFSLYNLYCKIA